MLWACSPIVRGAYGYRTVERFLSLLAHAGVTDRLTAALARWTAAVWLPHADPSVPTIVYIDGHHKPIHTDARIPRGLIGRTGKILGCRALTLLHDSEGHVLLAQTARGDQHLTAGAPAILAAYEAANPQVRLATTVIDREGMSAPWLAQLVAAGRTVVTLLRRDQYVGLESFTDVGVFTPLTWDALGQVQREVAPARFVLPVPGQLTGLPLWVALIRDHTWQDPLPNSTSNPVRWTADLTGPAARWWEPGWQAPPAPATPTTPHLIPIVSTAPTDDAVALAALYTRRWPCQENVIRDWLLPVGLDTNHGYTKQLVANSEQDKKRKDWEARLARLARWAERARDRSQRAGARGCKRRTAAKMRAQELERELMRLQFALEAQNGPKWEPRQQWRAARAQAETELDRLEAAAARAEDECAQERAKVENYCREQRHLKRQLADLAARERQMFEAENDKDQIMTVCKVALVTLGMVVRDRWFPPSYATATWGRLAPFFALRGRVRQEPQWVQVELRPFNDRALNRDLAELCTRVAEREAWLPDGRRLIFSVGTTTRSVSDA